MKIICAALLLALLTGAAEAKCPERQMHVYGKVETAPGVPAKGVPVGVAWLRLGVVGGPALAVTADDGSFSVRFGFHSHSGSGIFGDRCKARLTHVSVAAQGDGVQSTPVEIVVGEAGEVGAGIIGRDLAPGEACGAPACDNGIRVRAD